jgi:hypothetical protein
VSAGAGVWGAVQGGYPGLVWLVAVWAERGNGGGRRPSGQRHVLVCGASIVVSQVGLKTIGNGRENAQTITVTIFFAGIGNGNENVGRKNETGITRYRERNIFNRERVDYDRESVTRKRNICRLTAMHNPYANKSITHKIIVL